MVFKAKKDDFSETTIGLNNPLSGIFSGDFFEKKSILSDSDINALKLYNAEIERGVSPVTAYYRALQDASDAAVDMAKSAGDSIVNISSIPKVSKAASLGLKALSVAGNTLISIGISLAIAGLIKGMDYLIHRSEKLQEAAEKAQQDYEEAKQKLDDVNSKIADYEKRINELQGKTLSPVEESELRKVQNLNEQLKIEKELLESIESIKKKEASDKATKSINSKKGGMTRMEQFMNIALPFQR